MRSNIEAYDACLESFSKSQMPLINYTLNEIGKMTVSNNTVKYYRYPDMTTIAETMFQFIQITIEKEMVCELNFLKNYDITKTAIQKIDLFIRFCLQNKGILSSSKHRSHFSELTDTEIQQMQFVVQKSL